MRWAGHDISQNARDQKLILRFRINSFRISLEDIKVDLKVSHSRFKEGDIGGSH